MQPPDIITKEWDVMRPNLGFKKVFCEDGNEVVLFLSMDDSKCKQRPTETLCGIASKVTVLAIYDMWGYRTDLKVAHSFHDNSFVYRKGRTYAPTNGIWYWPTFRQAQSYWLNAGKEKNPTYEKLVKERNS